MPFYILVVCAIMAMTLRSYINKLIEIASVYIRTDATSSNCMIVLAYAQQVILQCMLT